MDAARAVAGRGSRATAARRRRGGGSDGNDARASSTGAWRVPGRGLPRRSRARANVGAFEPDLLALTRHATAVVAVLLPELLVAQELALGLAEVRGVLVVGA